MQWNKNVLRFLMSALLVACVHTARTAGASPPQTRQCPPVPAGLTGQHVCISLSVGTDTRTALVYVPKSYDDHNTTAVSLIVNFHGFGSTGKEQELLSGMSALADHEGFLVAYPDGHNGKWNVDPDGPPGSASAADRQFIRDLVHKLVTAYSKVNPKWVYAAGMSNGGGMANRVGCDMADIFAAIAPVEGGYPEPGWKDCVPWPPHHMPVMAFHGRTDHIVPYDGGQGGGPPGGPAAQEVFPKIQDWAAAWASRNSCSYPLLAHPSANVTCQEWFQCAGDASVILYTINPHGHTWPRGKPIDATAEMWKFFQAHPMP